MRRTIACLGFYYDVFIGNPNLAGGAARIILNEVTSTNPSTLRGYTEVAGTKAEVIIASKPTLSVPSSPVPRHRT